jgi:RNA polymerase sigma factor (sigma-70 family)
MLQASRRPSSRAETDALPRWDYEASGEQFSGRQEQELAMRAQAGSEAARDRMIQANIPLVVSVARQYRNAHLEMEDLIQEGMIGLCTALERFNPSKGFRFSTYATYWIRQRILRALDRHGRLIRLPVDVGAAARKAEEVRARLTARLGREPSVAELAPECGISAKRLQAVLECMQDPIALDAPTGDEGDPLTLEVPDPQTPDPAAGVIQEENHRQLRALLETLSNRDRLVLEGRFGLDGATVPLAELADRLAVSSEGVRQIQRRALLKLRRRLLQMQDAGS